MIGICQERVELCGGNKTHAAESLGISLPTMRAWLKS